MSVQSTLNKQALDMLPRVQAAISGAKYHDIMSRAAITMILDSSMALDDMTKDDLSAFEEGVLEYFEEREWIGERPEQFRFESGSLYEYSKRRDAYIHCFKNAFCDTKQKAINEYLKQQ